MKNLNSLVWLQENHPEVFEQYKQFSKKRKSERSKKFMRDHYLSAKKNTEE